jgi:hypothetical protein
MSPRKDRSNRTVLHLINHLLTLSFPSKKMHVMEDWTSKEGTDAQSNNAA